MNYSELEFITFCCIAILVAFCMLGVLHTQLRRKYNTLKSFNDYLEEMLDEQRDIELKLKIKCEALEDDLMRIDRAHYDWVKELEAKGIEIDE